MRRFIFVAAVSLAVAIVSAGPVGAHAEIRESDPMAGGSAPTGTDVISMTFITMDPDAPVEVSVTDAAGTDQTSGAPEVVETTALGSVVTVALNELTDGTYTVAWQATSTDGDGLSRDTFEFTVEPASGGGFGVWLLWIVALAIPAAIFLRPGARRKST